ARCTYDGGASPESTATRAIHRDEGPRANGRAALERANRDAVWNRKASPRFLRRRVHDLRARCALLSPETVAFQTRQRVWSTGTPWGAARVARRLEDEG